MLQDPTARWRTIVNSASLVPPYVKAHTTGRWAEIIFRALSSRDANRWQFISFRGAKQGEWRGVVDVLAIRKNTEQPTGEVLKRGDLFDIILVQIKGGSAPSPSKQDRMRLREVGKRYRAKAIVLFEWRKGVWSNFYRLDRKLEWVQTDGKALFG